MRGTVIVFLLVLFYVTHADTVYPKSKAKMAKLVSSALTDDIINCGFDRFYDGVKNKKNFQNTTDDLIASCKGKLMSQSKFVLPVAQLSTKVESTSTFVNQLTEALTSQWKGFFTKAKKMNIKNKGQFDNKLSSKIITKPNCKNVFKAIKKKVSSSDWKALISTFGGVLNFSVLGLS